MCCTTETGITDIFYMPNDGHTIWKGNGYFSDAMLAFMVYSKLFLLDRDSMAMVSLCKRKREAFAVYLFSDRRVPGRICRLYWQEIFAVQNDCVFPLFLVGNSRQQNISMEKISCGRNNNIADKCTYPVLC